MRLKFKQSMLDYCKLILSKMSFDARLFKKEYRKSLNYLAPAEQYELRKWLRAERQLTSVPAESKK